MNASIDAATRAVQAVELASRGDERAFTEIVEAYHRDLLRVCYTICRDADLAEEAAQATWLLVWRKLATLREPDRIRPWVLAIGANQARKLLLGRRRRVVVELEVAGGSTDSALGSLAGDLDLRNALAQLSADDRALLALRYVAGLNSSELSRATRLSPSGTRARLARLLDRLRTELTDG